MTEKEKQEIIAEVLKSKELDAKIKKTFFEEVEKLIKSLTSSVLSIFR